MNHNVTLAWTHELVLVCWDSAATVDVRGHSLLDASVQGSLDKTIGQNSRLELSLILKNQFKFW